MLFYITIIFAIIFDILTKYLASIFLQNPINLLWDFLYLQFVKNSWIAFSISLPFLKIITIVLIIWIFYYYITNYKLKPESWKAKYEKQKIEKLWHFNKSKLEDKEVLFFELSASNLIDLSFWFILWGAIWNWIERVFFSEVSDFIWIKYFAIFNFADIFITIWVILYLIYLLKFKK
jgi:lipoprotein signal peptidase